MRDGFIKAAAITPGLKVADVKYNGAKLERAIREASANGAHIIVCPELALTGYSCGDLFFQTALIDAARDELIRLAAELSDVDGIVFVGLPLAVGDKLYNTAAAISRGQILGFVPKSFLPEYGEFYEARQFTRAHGDQSIVTLPGVNLPIPFGRKLLFAADSMPGLVIAAELCEDLWVPDPPSVRAALSGATVIVNLSASNELVGKSAYRRSLVALQSGRLYAGYIYASAGVDESTQDVVYSAHRIIAENGSIIAESPLFSEGILYADIDIEAISARRRQMGTYESRMAGQPHGYQLVRFSLRCEETALSREYSPTPFVPHDPATLAERCEEILSIQALGLKKRLVHTGCSRAVIGISGGLDSTLALLVTVRAFDMAGLSRDGITAVTMPGFGTTGRTHDNAVALIRALGASFKEISIVNAVTVHFSDIGQDINDHSVTYENSQARERTQILMDMANREGGLVVGTGDLSELALGWATYNGDHMSMYGVNASVPKTLVRHLVRYYADRLCGGSGELARVLYDILDTPVSPELLPPENGNISQRTEDIVGPYELHDFFLYYMLRMGFSPKKIYRLARLAFDNSFTGEEILKWEKVFYRRFFSQQFKRSCLPDGPKVGTVALSPRGDLRMPSDASAALWLRELDEL